MWICFSRLHGTAEGTPSYRCRHKGYISHDSMTHRRRRSSPCRSERPPGSEPRSAEPRARPGHPSGMRAPRLLQLTRPHALHRKILVRIETRLVHRHHLPSVVEPVGLRAQNLDLQNSRGGGRETPKDARASPAGSYRVRFEESLSAPPGVAPHLGTALRANLGRGRGSSCLLLLRERQRTMSSGPPRLGSRRHETADASFHFHLYAPRGRGRSGGTGQPCGRSGRRSNSKKGVGRCLVAIPLKLLTGLAAWPLSSAHRMARETCMATTDGSERRETARAIKLVGFDTQKARKRALSRPQEFSGFREEAQSERGTITTQVASGYHPGLPLNFQKGESQPVAAELFRSSLHAARGRPGSAPLRASAEADHRQCWETTGKACCTHVRNGRTGRPAYHEAGHGRLHHSGMQAA